jgi:RHS repeat-associated protein
VDSTCQWTFGEEDMDWSGKWYLGSRQYSFYKDLGVGTVCSLERVQNPYGYHKGSNYYYYLKDHLGNVREVWYDAQWVVPRPPKSPYLPDATVQRTQYYAHGLPYAEGTGISTQPNKYNGKEFIEMHGYDTYDYGWRGLYSAIGRFTTIDLLAEKYYDVSPYAYCLNNPVKYIDPDGRVPRIYVETQGLGHTFITTGEGKNTTVYTYGRYGNVNKSSSGGLSMNGEGVLIIMKGQEALNYIQNEYKNQRASIYELQVGEDAKVDAFFNETFEASNQKPSRGYYKDSDNARVIDTYDLLDNNCTTKTSEAVKIATDGKLDLQSKSPANAVLKLQEAAKQADEEVKQIQLNTILDEYEK